MTIADTTAKNPSRVAVPYYGALKRPGTGLERIYFFADVDSRTGKLTELSMGIWNIARQPQLSAWLKGNGVEGLLCSDLRLDCERSLTDAGLWVKCGQTGELSEVVTRWSMTMAA